VSTKILHLKGNNIEIGRSLGKFWGNYFYNLSKSKNKHSKELSDNYKEWLQNDEIDEKRWMLLVNMVEHYPDLFDELDGMDIGINESKIGFRTSLFGLFTCWLAETDSTFQECKGCSSVLLPIENGFYLAHSDEYDKQYPLVVANVSLNTTGKTAHFISISHPFQLLGSAAGMNSNFAFQGNSIGCNEEIFEKLQRTWKKRIPKTVFTRMMLEMSGIDEIRTLYQKHTSTLPNHQYVVFRDRAYSIEVRPTARKELIINELEGNKTHIHSNHFLSDDSHQWAFSRGDEKRSIRRRDFLIKKMEGVKSATNVKTRFREFLNEYPPQSKNNKLIDRTSGDFFFTIRKGEQLSCQGKLYYDGTPFSISTNPKNISLQKPRMKKP